MNCKRDAGRADVCICFYQSHLHDWLYSCFYRQNFVTVLRLQVKQQQHPFKSVRVLLRLKPLAYKTSGSYFVWF